MAAIFLCFVPLIAATFINRRLNQMMEPPVSTSVVWLGALVLGFILAAVVNVAQAYDTLMRTGDFVVVVFRTLLFVIARVPFSFLLGLTFALILNSDYLPGRTFFRVMLFVPWAASSLAILMALILAVLLP